MAFAKQCQVCGKYSSGRPCPAKEDVRGYKGRVLCFDCWQDALHNTYLNKKNGKAYVRKMPDARILMATNGQEGVEVVLYSAADGTLYVRDKAEFASKFEKVEDE